MMGVDTFPKLLKFNSERWGNEKVAMRYKKFGVWGPCTWKQYYEESRSFGLGLLSLGLRRGETVGIIGDNSPEAFFTELGAQVVGGIVLGLYTDAISDELKYLAEHSDTVFAVVNDQEQVDKFLEIKDELPKLKKIIYWDSKGLVHYDDPIMISFGQVQELGRKMESKTPGSFEETIAEGKGDDVAVLLYTSGTKGLPKGAMLTYKNILSGIKAVMELDAWTEDSRSFSFLPLAWVPEQLFGIAGPLVSGGSVNFPEEPETVTSDVRDIGPTQLFYGSRLWESLTSMMQARITESTFIKRHAYKLLFPMGYKWLTLKEKGGEPGFFWKTLHCVADRLLFRPIRDDMGLSHLTFAWSSGASLSPDSCRLLQAIGIPIRNHYASTEVCAVCNSGKDFRAETVGRPVPGTKIRISSEGEILVKSAQVFKGYYKDRDATDKAIIDGWFHTGDAGFIDDDGHLIFLDRLDDLTKLAGGEKVAPQYIESRLRFSPYITDAMVLADPDKPYVAAILTISFVNVGRWAEMKRINYTTYTDLS
ncbi:MAG TPA: AMP-binding protein, partial [Desulfobacteraceae bacterium]|nr:AMP-binding protein [Desulfobacteraceae bacterium]